jgi:uncharacterized membrane protein YbhN (UPF0104 family)
MWLWHSVAILSGTAFGLQPDGILTSVAVSPDEAEARNIFPMLLLSVLAIVGVWLNDNREFLSYLKFEVRKDLSVKDKRYYKSIIVVGFVTMIIWITYFLASWLPVR